MSRPLRKRYGRMAPTVLTFEGYKVRFYSKDRGEPPHAHLRRGGGEMKVWLGPPIEMSFARKLKKQEVRKGLAVAEANRAILLARWRAFFRE